VLAYTVLLSVFDQKPTASLLLAQEGFIHTHNRSLTNAFKSYCATSSVSDLDPAEICNVYNDTDKTTEK